jgi:hypothetical protein|tara:strand:- start:113 stop:391 length:279 start_codon:yes stop_codon:yes gene_type:complete
MRYYIPTFAKRNAKRGLNLSSKRNVGAKNLVSAYRILNKDKLNRKEAKLIANFYGDRKNKKLNDVEMMLNGGAKFGKVIHSKVYNKGKRKKK